MHHDALFDPVDGLEGFYACLLTPLVTPPALHQQQQVERRPVFGVVGLEVVSDVFYVSLDVGLQQQVGRQRAGVVRGFALLTS